MNEAYFGYKTLSIACKWHHPLTGQIHPLRPILKKLHPGFSHYFALHQISSFCGSLEGLMTEKPRFEALRLVLQESSSLGSATCVLTKFWGKTWNVLSDQDIQTIFNVKNGFSLFTSVNKIYSKTKKIIHLYQDPHVKPEKKIATWTQLALKVNDVVMTILQYFLGPLVFVISSSVQLVVKIGLYIFKRHMKNVSEEKADDHDKALFGKYRYQWQIPLDEGRFQCSLRRSRTY